MQSQPTDTRILLAEPLSASEFQPYGYVVQAYAGKETAPFGTKVTQANQGSALKFHKLSPILSSYPESSGATTNLSVYRCKALDFDFNADSRDRGPGWPVKLLERHAFTNQAFIPMGTGSGGYFNDQNSLSIQGRAYLVVVALNGEDDGPDLNTMKAFVASAGQSVVYNTGVWRKSFSSIICLTLTFFRKTILW